MQIENLKKFFPISGGVLERTENAIRAVDGVSFSISKGESLGLVGESGCGKTTVGRCILGLERPTSGSIRFEGELISTQKRKELKKIRSKIQVVFQDPYSSLNPRWSIKDIVAEPLVANGMVKRREVRRSSLELLKLVGLNEDHLDRFPHEFSGGQRQRIGIARALSVNPSFIVLDEPTSSLDVSVQAQILNLLNKLQSEFNLTYLFISHNLSVVKHMCDRVAVMYLGRIVELASSTELFTNPLHPYTRALLSSVPVPDTKVKRNKVPVIGDIPSASNPPTGCYFNPRCPIAADICRTNYPDLKEYSNGHLAACFFADSIGGRMNGSIAQDATQSLSS